MNGFRLIILLLAFTPAIWADDKPKDKPTEKPKVEKPATPADEYKALEKEFNQAQSKAFESSQKAKTDEERAKVTEDIFKLRSQFGGRFLQLAQKNPKTDAALDCLFWVITNAEQAPAADAAGAALVRDFLGHQRMKAIVDRMAYSQFPIGENIVREVLEKSKDNELQGIACLTVAKISKNKSEMVHAINGLDEKTLKQVEKIYGKAFLDRIRKVDTVKELQVAEAMFDRASKEFGDVKFQNQTLRELAKPEIFEIKFLAVGKTPPDIVGEDIDGKKFKLSDYRGKVVVLDFWGNW